MKEKLIIRNFGPIKNVEIELGRVNVLIGDQGTGKSTVAKVLLAIMNTFYRELLDLRNSDLTIQFMGHIELVGLGNFLFFENTIIEYNCERFGFSFTNKKVEVHKKKQLTFEENLAYDFTYIPAERNLVVPLSDALYSIIESKINLPNLFLRFGNKFQTARSKNVSSNYESILGVEYIYENAGDWVVLNTGNKIPMKDSSTGMQGSLVLLKVLDYVNKTQQGNLIVIEELEMNLFPTTQNKLTQYLVSETLKVDNSLLLTTHSPYILTSLNNLMYAYKLGHEHKSEVANIIEEKYWINPEDVSAYMLLPDGTCEDILDRDESGTLIKAEKIDTISRELNTIFDDLIEIEHNDRFERS